MVLERVKARTLQALLLKGHLLDASNKTSRRAPFRGSLAVAGVDDQGADDRSSSPRKRTVPRGDTGRHVQADWRLIRGAPPCPLV